METNLDVKNFKNDLEKAIEVIYDYTSHIGDAPVIPDITREELLNSISREIPKEGMESEKLIQYVREKIVPNCTKIGSPRFLSWIITSPCQAGTVGEIINLGLNQTPFCFKGGPAATVLEDIVISWFLSLFGYSDKGGGILVSGGTAGTLTALAAAREAFIPGAMENGIQGIEKPLVVYVSDQAHVSVDKAVGILGIGTKYLRKIPTDEKFKIKTDILKKEIEKDKMLGLRPFCVVAQSGTSNAGSVDDIEALSGICTANNMWLHVDAAFGGGAILTEEGKKLMKGIEKADSISMDPHKWMFIPVEAGCVLVKDRKHLYNAYKFNNSTYNENESLEYSSCGIQSTRMSRAFKIWFAIKSYGIDKYQSVIQNNMKMADAFYKMLCESSKFQSLCKPELSAVCFRYVPEVNLDEALLNKLQGQIAGEIEKSGEAFFATAVVNGKTYMRVNFANHRTTYEDMEYIYNLVVQTGMEIENILVEAAADRS